MYAWKSSSAPEPAAVAARRRLLTAFCSMRVPRIVCFAVLCVRCRADLIDPARGKGGPSGAKSHEIHIRGHAGNDMRPTLEEE